MGPVWRSWTQHRTQFACKPVSQQEASFRAWHSPHVVTAAHCSPSTDPECCAIARLAPCSGLHFQQQAMPSVQGMPLCQSEPCPRSVSICSATLEQSCCLPSGSPRAGVVSCRPDADALLPAGLGSAKDTGRDGGRPPSDGPRRIICDVVFEDDGAQRTCQLRWVGAMVCWPSWRLLSLRVAITAQHLRVPWTCIRGLPRCNSLSLRTLCPFARPIF